jgi:predicted metal-dependent peptidase
MNNKEVFRNTLTSMLVASGEYSNTYMFYGFLIAQCKRNFDENMQAPAAISFEYDTYVLHINPILFNEFTLVQRLGVLKHEMLHILNGHVQRAEDRIHLAWNFATDCAINQQIVKEHLPEGCIYPNNFPVSEDTEVPENQTAEFYYSLLESELDKLQEDCNDCNGSGKQKAPTLDDHGKWQESKGDSDLQKDITKKMIDTATNETQKSNGSLPSELSTYLALHSRNNEVDWRKVLRNIVGNKRANTRRTLMRRDRRFPNRPDIKGKTKDRVFSLLVISDVSGSVSDDALIELLGEVRNICKLTNTPVNLIQVDTEPKEPEKLLKNTTIIERKANGGTLLSPAIKKADETRLEYNAIVVTTDGWLDTYDVEAFTKTNKRVIWLIEPGGKVMPEMNSGKMQAFKLKK